MDLCLSCKGCKSECPSNVDMGKLKQEWQYQYYKEKGVPFRSWLIGNFSLGMKLASIAMGVSCCIWKSYNRSIGQIDYWFCGRSKYAEILLRYSWEKWFKTKFKPTTKSPIKTVYLFVDELLNFNEAEIGIATVTLLDRWDMTIIVLDHKESGRSFLSKGLLEEARNLLRKMFHFSRT